MSAALLQLVWERYPQPGARLNVLQAIAEAANEQGNCYVTVTQIGAAARLSRSAAQRAVNQLRDERWIVTSRMLGQGARLVYQLNLPKLTRSCRDGVDPAAMQAQRLRTVGPTEAGLAERIRLREAEGQSDTATQSDTHAPFDTESQSDTAPSLPQTDDQGRADERAEHMLARHAGEMFDDDELQGAEVPATSHGSLLGAARASFEADFGSDEPLEEDDEAIAALKMQAEKRGAQW